MLYFHIKNLLKMRPFVKIVFENVVNKLTFTGRHESLIQLPDSVIPVALHKQILSFHKYKTQVTCSGRQYKIYILNEYYRQVTIEASGNDLYLLEATFSDHLLGHGWTLACCSARLSVKVKRSDLKEFFIVTAWLGPEENGARRGIATQEEVGCVSIKFDYEESNIIFTGRKNILTHLPTTVVPETAHEDQEIKGPSVSDNCHRVPFNSTYHGLKMFIALQELTEARMEHQMLKKGWKLIASCNHSQFDSNNKHSVFQKWISPKGSCSPFGHSASASAIVLPGDEVLPSTFDDLEPPPSYEEVMRSHQLESENLEPGSLNSADGASENAEEKTLGILTIKYDYLNDKVTFSGRMPAFQNIPLKIFPTILMENLSSPRLKEKGNISLKKGDNFPDTKMYALDIINRSVKMKNVSTASAEGMIGELLLHRKWTLAGYSGMMYGSMIGHFSVEKWCVPANSSESGDQPGLVTISFDYEMGGVSILGRKSILNLLPEQILPGEIRGQVQITNSKVKMKHETGAYRIIMLSKKPLCLVEVIRSKKLDYNSEPLFTEHMSHQGWTLISCCANVKDRREDFYDHFIILQKWLCPNNL